MHPVPHRAKNAHKPLKSVADVCDKSLNVLPTSATNHRMCALFPVIQLTCPGNRGAPSKLRLGGIYSSPATPLCVIHLMHPVPHRAKNAHKPLQSVADVCDKSLNLLPTSATNHRMCALFPVIQLTCRGNRGAPSKLRLGGIVAVPSFPCPSSPVPCSLPYHRKRSLFPVSSS
jgi:hypothetical protein